MHYKRSEVNFSGPNGAWVTTVRSAGLSTSKKGKIVENLVGAFILQQSNGKLSVATPVVDDEGVDLIVYRRQRGDKGIFLQVKGRWSGTKTILRGVFLADIRRKTFNPSPNYYVLCPTMDEENATLGPVLWLIPSKSFARNASPTRKDEYLRMTTGYERTDEWKRYRMPSKEMPQALLRLLE